MTFRAQCRACGGTFSASNYEEARARTCPTCRVEGLRVMRALLVALVVGVVALAVALWLVS